MLHPDPRSPALDTALLLLRVAPGAVLFAHGAQKLFVYGLEGVTGSFAQMGMPLPGVLAPVVAFVELLGGAALVLGLLTRWAAVALAIDMLVAMVVVHLPNGFFLPSGIEFTLVLAAATLALAITGAGSYSLDALLPGRRRDDTRAATPLSERRHA